MENNNDASSDTNTTPNAIVSMENLNQVANWFGATVISAFFSSLERFSCVNVATNDPDDDDNEDEVNVRPLSISTDHHQSDDVANLPV
ncbi:uncharacterized protein LOC110620889 [Manihot esculenta]|uniref:Uncharacterized protein n=1 Tax=Manihot esculenta TaxID=3983 RepID=A0A2C9WJC4_MANES|nr:uncharacterized protein LOC110620889 [Manihot esculenta]OAY59717.1 hypothetical protein MANES_01G053400v8 [Manihot esculenta]